MCRVTAGGAAIWRPLKSRNGSIKVTNILVDDAKSQWQSGSRLLTPLIAVYSNCELNRLCKKTDPVPRPVCYAAADAGDQISHQPAGLMVPATILQRLWGTPPADGSKTK